MDLDDSYGIKAAFQLIPQEAYKGFDELVSQIRARGFEMNIHDLDHDGRLYEQKGLFESVRAKINKYGNSMEWKDSRSGSMHRNQSGSTCWIFSMTCPCRRYRTSNRRKAAVAP